MYVMTIDQRHSSSAGDAVPRVLTLLSDVPTVRAFERTAGDEVQGLLDDPQAVIELTARLARTDGWYVGIGVGDVEQPLVDSVRANRGEAFIAARAAVERAKSALAHVAVEGRGVIHAETSLLLLLNIIGRRTDAGWQAVEAMTTATTQTAAAASLGISAQAMNRRLRVAGYVEERRGVELAVHLLREAS